jgi:thiamine biosynthesis lipoprotein
MTSPLVRGSFLAMSTTVEVLGVGISTQDFDRAIAVARQLADSWEDRFSRFRAGSQLIRLNAARGRPTKVDSTFISLLEMAADGVRRTGGRFDPSVLPALEAAGYTDDIEQVRAGATVRSGSPQPAAGVAGWNLIHVDAERGEVSLPPEMRLDFGGIAKGGFVDHLAAALAGWPGGIVDAGGDLRVWGTRPDGTPWAVGIEDPVDPSRDLLVVCVDPDEGGGIATSGPNRRHWTVDGVPQHHLIDPRTGRPLAGRIRSVSAFAPSVVAAEITTKAMLVAETDQAPYELVGSSRAVVVYDDGRVESIAGAVANAHPPVPNVKRRRPSGVGRWVRRRHPRG